MKLDPPRCIGSVPDLVEAICIEVGAMTADGRDEASA
jgi:hypothetical protein